MRRLVKLLLVCLVALLGIGVGYRLLVIKEDVSIVPTPEPTPTPVVKEEYEAKMFFTGDMLIHGTVWMDAHVGDNKYDFSNILSYINEISQGYDLKYYNQETILGGVELGLSGYPRFNSPQEVGQAMVDMGFNLVSTANNHSLDKDEQGIINSLTFWNSKENVHNAGTYLSWEDQQAIPVYEVNGITYTFLSWTYGCNGLTPPAGKEYLVNIYPGREEELLEQVRKANEISDVVIVAMHWGTEYSFDINSEQAYLAEELNKAGADIIIGNHPHVIQPAAWVNNTICFYAMGNLLSAQIEQPNLVGMVGALTIHKTVEGDNTTITIDGVKADLIYTYYDPGYVNFKVIPFNKLDEAHLHNYQEVYEQYKNIILKLDNSIEIGEIELQ